MYIIKRDGRKQDVYFDKITERIKNLKNKSPILEVDPILIAQKVVAGLYNSITTTQLDELAADISVSLSTLHPDYETLASRITISNLHKNTINNYGSVCDHLYFNINKKTHEASPLLSTECYNFIKNNIDVLQTSLNYEKDYDYDYFGIKTLQKSYLLKIDNVIVERIQHMLMRVAVGIHQPNLDNVLQTYKMLSDKLYILATPTLFNSGTPRSQCSSCFLLSMQEDSIAGIYDTLKQCALISKYAGGIGVHIHNIRGKNSYIKGTNGYSNGIVPMLKNFNDTARYVDQGGGKRKGSIAIYLEPHHVDIEDFLELKKPQGKDEVRCRDLFYAVWVSDLFMQRVEEDKNWSLFCPNEAPGLSDVYSTDFNNLYLKYEQEGRARKVVRARELWSKIMVSQIETGTPYLLYKDTVNTHNNQSNLGTIKSSNLCVSGDTYILTDQGQIQIKTLKDQEVNIWNGEEWSKVTVRQTGVNQELLKITCSNNKKIKCTLYHKFYLSNNNKIEAKDLKIDDVLISFKLPDNTIVNNIKITKIRLLEEKEDTYCFKEEKRHKGVFNGILTGQCCEIFEYTDKENIAVCNLASVALPKCVVDNQFDFNKLYTITYHVINDLNKIIDVNYYPVPEAKNSNLKHRPVGCGVIGLADTFMLLKLPFDSIEAKKLNQDIFETMYYAATKASCDLAKIQGPYSSYEGSPASKGLLCPDLWDCNPSNRWDFKQLREDIKQYGLRNSLLLSVQPTASTSNILGYTESIEPITSNIYVRRVLSGEYVMLNKYLIKDLIKLNLWNNKLKDLIISNNGSIQGVNSIPDDIKLLYRTVFEIPLKNQIDMNCDRQRFVDQGISFNVFMAEPTENKLTSLHFYSHKKGIKTSSYYIRSKPATNAIQYTIDKNKLDHIIVYTRTLCHYCEKAKDLLKSKNLNYTEIDVSHQESYNQMIKECGQVSTVPQIVINNKHIGGYTELNSYFNQEEKQEICESCSN